MAFIGLYPEDGLDQIVTTDTSDDGTPAQTLPRGATRAALADAIGADSRSLVRAAGTFPSRALSARAARVADAIDESLDLFSDPADPFESVRDFVEYPEARRMVTI